MSKTKIAKRYAKSFFDLACERECLEPVRTDLIALRTLIEQSAEFAHFLADPVLTTERRSTILKAILRDKVEPWIFQFIMFLEAKHRIHLLELICRCFEDYYHDYKGILKVDIISACELAPEQVAAISAKLQTRYNKEIVTGVQLDPSLLGGFKIIVGDTVLDYSLVIQLTKIRQNIINA